MGVNPGALVHVVQELRRESVRLQQSEQDARAIEGLGREQRASWTEYFEGQKYNFQDSKTQHSKSLYRPTLQHRAI